MGRKDGARYLIGCAFVLLAFFGATIDIARADRVELRSVQGYIQFRGARWIAGENSLSVLPTEQRRLFLGLRKSQSPPKFADSGRLQIRSQNLPSHLDWRQHQDENWLTPVKDQGPCGSCWAFSAIAALESTIAIRARNPSLILDLSEQFLLSCSPGDCNGYWLGPTMSFLEVAGTVDEACFPYTGEDTTLCSNRCPDWQESVFSITNWSYIPNNVEAIRAALNQQVLSTTFDVYSDLFYYVGGVYEHVGGERIGGHAVLLVGYDDVEHAWIAKNSWGPGWGEGGYFKILWGDCGIGSDTIMLQYSNPCDEDEDGYLNTSCGGKDCDDQDYQVHPKAVERCDGKDSNCDGVLPHDEVDGDGDGWPLCNDCQDRQAGIHPGAMEICGDGIDNDCSGRAEDKDLDADGFTDPACGGTDCDDEDPHTYPGASEVCDGRDNNCNGALPVGEQDLDGDTWLVCAGDCNDQNPSVHPGRAEVCGNGLDDDCDNDRDDKDIECATPEGWSAANPASATQQTRGEKPARSISLVGGYLLWLFIPLLVIAVIRCARWRRRPQT